jgi:dihydropyrimidinase
MSAPPPCDVLITGGAVVTENGVEHVDVAVTGERISALLPTGSAGAAERVIDAGGLVVLPGGVDPHTHVHWPFDGRRSAETVAEGTRAAITGGTTTIVDFAPPRDRHEDVLDALERRREEFDGASACDHAFHSILTSAEGSLLDRVGDLVERGTVSFKIFTAMEMGVDDAELWALLQAIAAAGGIAAIHAENDVIARRASAELEAEGRLDFADFPASRPEICEVEAISTVLTMAETLGSPVYLLHLTSARGLSLVRRAQAAGIRVVAETCSHYLEFSDDVFRLPEAWRYMLTPPIRGAEARDALWQGLADGAISTVGSDHCAYAIADKTATGRYVGIPFGAPGIHERLALLYDRGVRTGRLRLEALARAYSTAPARTLGLYPQKGTLRAGSDADVVLLDPTRPWRFTDDSPATGEYTVYSGLSGVGAPVLTMLRGRVVAENGALVSDALDGRFVPRAPIHPTATPTLT